MVLTERDRRLLQGVADFGIVTREQVATLLKFGSVTRANAVLLRLAKHRYLARRLQPTLRGTRRLTYFLGPLGEELLGAATPEQRRQRWESLSDLFVEHRLDCADVRIAFTNAESEGYEFVRWLSDRELGAMQLPLIPDGYCEYRMGGKLYCVFVEVDRGTESRKLWTHKVNAYMAFAFGGAFANAFNRQFFRVLVAAPSARRLRGIADTIAKRTDKIFWLTAHADLLRQGPFAAIWRRPTGDDLHSLTNQ